MNLDPLDEILERNCTGMDDHDEPYDKCPKCAQMKSDLLALIGRLLRRALDNSDDLLKAML